MKILLGHDAIWSGMVPATRTLVDSHAERMIAACRRTGRRHEDNTIAGCCQGCGKQATTILGYNMRGSHRIESENTIMADTEKPAFDAQYGPLVKDAFRDQVARDRAGGADLAERARHYVARGKPDFVLAYLVETDLGDGEKRELLA